MFIIARGQKQYTEEFKNTIVELYNSGKSLVELSSEYAISKSTITGWIKKNKPVSLAIFHHKNVKIYL